MSCERRHALVTGASTGIGRAAALRLAQAGWHVYAGVRRPDDGDALRRAARGGITPVLMDVTDADQIAAAAATIVDHVGSSGLDALVDNAGVGVTGPMEAVPLAALRHQFEVNVFGQVAVTQAVLLMLRKARGRIVIIGSIGDRFTPPFGGPLAASKAAIASIADALRQELAPWSIRVVLLEPASIHTDAIDKLQRDAHRTVDALSADATELYRDTYLGMVEAAMAREHHGSPPEVVGELVCKVLTSARPRARYVVGNDSQLLSNLVRFLPIWALDAMRRRVFRLPRPGARVNLWVLFTAATSRNALCLLSARSRLPMAGCSGGSTTRTGPLQPLRRWSTAGPATPTTSSTINPPLGRKCSPRWPRQPAHRRQQPAAVAAATGRPVRDLIRVRHVDASLKRKGE